MASATPSSPWFRGDLVKAKQSFHWDTFVGGGGPRTHEIRVAVAKPHTELYNFYDEGVIIKAQDQGASAIAPTAFRAVLGLHGATKVKALKGGGEARSIDIEEPDEPKARRYVVNDTTYEALGEILADNANGVLAFRDELVSLLKTLDREEHVAARGFFLSGWNGTAGYTFDRIFRGRTHIEAACLSLLGSTQPSRLAEYVRRAVTGAAGDDGLIPRLADQNPYAQSRVAMEMIFQG
jgi:hypothetical protein